MCNLQKLNLAGNEIEHIPVWFAKKLKSLRVLNLKGNKISSVSIQISKIYFSSNLNCSNYKNLCPCLYFLLNMIPLVPSTHSFHVPPPPVSTLIFLKISLIKFFIYWEKYLEVFSCF